MSRPRKYDDPAILEAAAAVFLENGAGASTLRIAERAGASEGILFKRFKTKEALFEAAMTGGTGSDQWRKVLLGSVGKGSPKHNLRIAILAPARKTGEAHSQIGGSRRPRYPTSSSLRPQGPAAGGRGGDLDLFEEGS
jgi:AcrR family transcriptional regulator